MDHATTPSNPYPMAALKGMTQSAEMQECIANCQSCHAICVSTLAYCLQQGGKHAAPAHIRLLLDCAQICQTSADFMLRGSELHNRTCGVCAEVCARCAEECARMGTDSQMQACAETCRRCAGSCRRMAA
jgi:hypothetical protein